MPLSVVDLYQKILPRTNCGDCGFPTCLAFASMVVSEKFPLSDCPHLDPDILPAAQTELDHQHAAGKWTKRDMAADALEWAKERAASMSLKDLPDRIGGKLIQNDGVAFLEIPYFTDTILIRPDSIVKRNDEPLNRWEQVFIYNHLAQGGKRRPTGNWKSLVDIPNTVSKVKSMKNQVQIPLIKAFKGRTAALVAAGKTLGGQAVESEAIDADVGLVFRPLPRIPVMLLFWDEEPGEHFDPEANLLFDETITEHLDIESIIFLSERLRQLLCGDNQ